jgi:PLP dependent protein
MTDDELPSRLEAVRSTVRESAARAGRSDDITLVAVSKTVDVTRIREAMDAGQYVFGENRVREGVLKIDALAGAHEGLAWHLLGHVQTNKVKSSVGRFDCVQSVDTFRLATQLDKRARDLGIAISVLLEVNVAGETSKSGFDPTTLQREMGVLFGLNALRVDGLMTVAPLASEAEDVRWVFRELRQLRDTIRDRYAVVGFAQLSMGMSNDYEVAIEEGATIVRIGRAIFGERPNAPIVRST